ncbi:hypothetical protein J5N97_013365 [Dioscorea zingiberensis]|uniref:Uncharacterized protein n=1 Tax=Dioscorea zingiberensis TaxID=325984 RepID=A0A9D5CQL6_9LILI|nr:hypothetical protein J5N97_013365 [Dioscorea zingiberensis]
MEEEATHKREYEQIISEEEAYWRQRSRINWLQQGDQNTKFFHAVANQRRNTNWITQLHHEGSTVTEPTQISDIISRYFTDLFGREREVRYKTSWERLFIHKREVELNNLKEPFREEEIRRAINELGTDKAPGLDGFPMTFYKQGWNVIKEDMLRLFEDFFQGAANMERLNWAHILLIPKNEAPENIKDYRPISLINCSVKIISKVLANRLKGRSLKRRLFKIE